KRERIVASKKVAPRAEPTSEGRRQHEQPNTDRLRLFTSAGWKRRHGIRLSVETIRRLTGTRPTGRYIGTPSANTRRLVVEEGGFLYDSDAYND
ncbi:MAG TPA: hypothetical protein VGY66_36590, partial [Gemmataceae bacterium]|nr:hypothetical protein [Gemmataceae bacterium]